MKAPELYIGDVLLLQALLTEKANELLSECEKIIKIHKRRLLIARFTTLPWLFKYRKASIDHNAAFWLNAMLEASKGCSELREKLDHSTGEGEDGRRITLKEMRRNGIGRESQ